MFLNSYAVNKPSKCRGINVYAIKTDRSFLHADATAVNP